MRNDEPRPRAPVSVTIWLTCGCSVRGKTSPMNPRVKYPCPSNLGHGYQLRWTRWRDGNRSGTNPQL